MNGFNNPPQLSDWLPTQLSGQTPGWHAAILSLVLFQTGRQQTFCAQTQMHLVADTSIFSGERTQQEARNVLVANLRDTAIWLPSWALQTFCPPTKLARWMPSRVLSSSKLGVKHFVHLPRCTYMYMSVLVEEPGWCSPSRLLTAQSYLQQQWGKNAETQWQLQRPEKFCLNLGPANTS